MILNHFARISYFILWETRRCRFHLMTFISCFTRNLAAFTSPVSTSVHLVYHFYYSHHVNSFNSTVSSVVRSFYFLAGIISSCSNLQINQSFPSRPSITVASVPTYLVAVSLCTLAIFDNFRHLLEQSHVQSFLSSHKILKLYP
jgi:hypothetical protein